MFENIDKFLMLVELFRLFIPEGKNKDIEEFKKWLVLHKHDSLVEVLNNQNQLANHLEGLIQDNSGKLEQQLKDINKMVSSIYARTAIFAPVANTLGIYSDLSEQAISILKQFVESGKDRIIAYWTVDEGFIYSIENFKNLILDRFAFDDFDILVKYEFLTRENGSGKTHFFRLTRLGFEYITRINNE